MCAANTGKTTETHEIFAKLNSEGKEHLVNNRVDPMQFQYNLFKNKIMEIGFEFIWSYS